MTTSSQEAQQTLNTLDRLIVVADCMGIGKTPSQRAALDALRARQTALRDLITSRAELAQEKIVSLDAWRKGRERPARAPVRRKLAAATLR